MRALYVEDNAIDVALARGMLARAAPDVEVEVATTCAEARARLDAPDDLHAVICDLTLPDGSGMELLGLIRRRGLPLVVLILTGTGDQDAVAAALKAGADGYLIKNKQPLNLLPRLLTRALANVRDGGAYRIRPLNVLYLAHAAADLEAARRYLARHAPHIHIEPKNRHSPAVGAASWPRLACGIAARRPLLRLRIGSPDG